jgi:transcriptional regulator with XRE-family HTH domain
MSDSIGWINIAWTLPPLTYIIIDNMPANASTALPIPVRRALSKLGKDIREARLRRRIPTAILAERAQMTRMTLYKIERGAPGVSMAAYVTVLFVLGLIDRVADLADVRADPVGLALEEERLPKRIRLRSLPQSRNKKVE